MPIYIAHGFRWPRDGFTGIRVHVIINDLLDVSSEYIQNEHSRSALLASFRAKHPDIMSVLENPSRGRGIDFLEQYDPDDTGERGTWSGLPGGAGDAGGTGRNNNDNNDNNTNAGVQPWAFVCDKVVMIAGGEDAERWAGGLVGMGGMRREPVADVSDPTSPITPGATSTRPRGASGSGRGGESKPKPKERRKTLPMTIAAPFTTPANIHALSINIDDVRAEGTGASPEAWHAFQELRDQIAEGETIGWWVVYNGDPDRAYESDSTEDAYDDDDEEGDENAATPSASRSPVKRTIITAPPKSPTPATTPGRMPPPVPPVGHLGSTQRSSTQSTLKSTTTTTTTTTSSSTGAAPSKKEKQRRISDPTVAAPSTSSSKSKSSGSGSKSQGLKKLFGKKS